MHTEHTHTLYEEIAQITAEMVLAARTQNWDRFVDLEAYCAENVEALRAQDHKKPLTTVALQKKVASIKKILADDREIRDLIDPWMARLSFVLNGNTAKN